MRRRATARYTPWAALSTWRSSHQRVAAGIGGTRADRRGREDCTCEEIVDARGRSEYGGGDGRGRAGRGAGDRARDRVAANDRGGRTRGGADRARDSLLRRGRAPAAGG